MPKKFHACSSVSKSTERHPRVPHYSAPLFPIIAKHYSLHRGLHYNLSPQVGQLVLWMRRKLSSTCFCSEGSNDRLRNYFYLVPGPRRLMKTERKLTLGTNMSGAMTDYFRNREANSLANKRTRLLLQGCPHMSWVLA